MREELVAALVSRYNATPRGPKRKPIARELCKETGESHLGTALEIGRQVLRHSKHPLVAALRAAHAARTKQQYQWDAARRRMSRETIR